MVGQCRKSDLPTFAITERAVEDFCFSHNHLTVALDEEGRSFGQERTSKVKTAFLPYLVPGGRGTVRSDKATQDQGLQNLSWAVLALSTGESPLDNPSRSTTRSEGAQVRMIGIPVQSGRDGGIFNRVSGTPQAISKQCKKLARQVERTISENYGVAMPEYLEVMVPKRSSLAKCVQSIIDKFVERVGANTDPWERRYAEKFGIVLAGAILMSDFGIGPWTRKRARMAISRLYKLARSITVSTNDATDTVLTRLRKLVKAGKRFPFVKKGAKHNEANSWGLVRDMPNSGRAVLVRLSRFERLVKPSAAARAVLIELDNRGILIKASGGKRTRQFMIKGSENRHRYVCLDRRALLSK
jgi:hypothetical protein